jgi:hypothetical protein
MNWANPNKSPSLISFIRNKRRGFSENQLGLRVQPSFKCSWPEGTPSSPALDRESQTMHVILYHQLGRGLTHKCPGKAVSRRLHRPQSQLQVACNAGRTLLTQVLTHLTWGVAGTPAVSHSGNSYHMGIRMAHSKRRQQWRSRRHKTTTSDMFNLEKKDRRQCNGVNKTHLSQCDYLSSRKYSLFQQTLSFSFQFSCFIYNF